MILTCYKIQNDGNIEQMRPKRISFHIPPIPKKVYDERLINILKNIDNDFNRVNELKKGIKHKKNTWANLLKEAEWFGIVEIIDKDEELEHWQIRKILL